MAPPRLGQSALLSAAILIAALITGCDPPIETRFKTIQEARARREIERGWLPPILPDSTTNIFESIDLDLNIGEGSFQFSASDYVGLTSLLTPASPDILERHWSSLSTKGFAVFIYSTNGSLWTLALHPRGDGRYRMEPLR